MQQTILHPDEGRPLSTEELRKHVSQYLKSVYTDTNVKSPEAEEDGDGLNKTKSSVCQPIAVEELV